MNPIDYTLSGRDPQLAFMEGLRGGQQSRFDEQNAVQGAQTHDMQMQTMSQNLALSQTQEDRAAQAFAQSQADRQAQAAAAEAEKAKQVQMQTELGDLADKVRDGTATIEDFATLQLKYPEMHGAISSAMDVLPPEKRTQEVFDLTRIATALQSGNVEVARKLVDDRRIAAENSNDKQTAQMMKAALAQLDMDPAAALTTLGVVLQMENKDAFEAVFGKGKVGGDERVQSSKTLDNGTTVTIMRDGSKVVTDAAGTELVGQAALDAIQSAADFEAEAAGTKAGAVEDAKNASNVSASGEIKSEEEAAKVNQKSVEEASARLATIASTLNTYDQAVAALDAGANTGVIAQKFPTITQAGALLDNAKLRAGLDVIASVTFGALSEGEREAAMQIAMPTNLDPPELRKWIENRKAAELKIAKIQRDAVEHFSQTGRSARELRTEWIKKYADTIPGLSAAPEQATAVGGSGSQDPSGVDDLLGKW